MKRKWILFAAASCAANCFAVPGSDAASIYAKPDFDTYQPILDRMPFGAIPETPVNVGPNAADIAKIQKEKEVLASKINMSAILDMPDGRTVIGFTDLSAKPPANHVLSVGETANGWTVLEADYAEETAVIQKDGVSITLQYGKGLVPDAPPIRPGLLAANQAVAAAVQAGMAPPPPGNPGAGRRPIPPGLQVLPSPAATPGRLPVPGAATPLSSSYKERQEQRAEADKAARDEADRKQQELLTRLAKSAADEAVRKKQQEEAEAQDAAAGEEEEEPEQ